MWTQPEKFLVVLCFAPTSVCWIPLFVTYQTRKKMPSASLWHGSWLNKPFTLYILWKLWLSRWKISVLDKLSVNFGGKARLPLDKARFCHVLRRIQRVSPKYVGVFSQPRPGAEFLKVGAVSFGRLGLIKRLTAWRHGVFKGDLSVPALTPRGWLPSPPVSPGFI